MTRSNIVLTVLLVLQLIIAGVLFIPGDDDNGSSTSGTLLGDLTVDDVTALTLTGDTGDTLTVRRDGDAWVLPDAGDFPANSQRVVAFIRQMLALNTSRLVAESPSSHRQLSVSDDSFQRRIEIARGDQTTTLYIGTAAGTNATHMRIGGQDAVYLTSGLSAFDVSVDMAQWIDATYLTLDAERIFSLTVVNASGTVAFSRGNDGAWTMADLDDEQVFLPDSVTPLVNQAANIRMRRPLGTEAADDYGLDEPLAVVTIRTRGSLAQGDGTATPDASDQTIESTYTLTIGAELEDGYVARVSNSDYYVLIAPTVAETFINAAQAAFLEAEEGLGIDVPGGDS
jgi:hypothetical protein